jgi:hypothetical protein
LQTPVLESYKVSSINEFSVSEVILRKEWRLVSERQITSANTIQCCYNKSKLSYYSTNPNIQTFRL